MAFGFEVSPSEGFRPPASSIQPTSEKHMMVLLNLTGYSFNPEVVQTIDTDSIIYFMQQYSPTKLTIIGDTLQELDDLLITAPELGAGLNESQIQRINPTDYLMYWNNYDKIVYVEDNYELALLASTYASLINSPLLIANTELDVYDTFLDKDIICVGSVTPQGTTCNEQYTLETLQQKYLDDTQTTKIVLTNPEDLDIFSADVLQPDKTSNPVSDLYGKTSLVAPIIASAKHELILTDNSYDYTSIDNNLETFFNNHYNEEISSCLSSDSCSTGFDNSQIPMPGATDTITFFLTGNADIEISSFSHGGLFVNTTNEFYIEVSNLGFDIAENVVLSAYEVNETTNGGGGGGGAFSSYSSEMVLIGTINLGDIAEDNSTEGIITWTPTEVGPALLWFNVSTTSNESNTENNDMNLYVYVNGPAPDLRVSVSHPPVLLVDEINQINTSISNIGTLPAGQFEVEFYQIDYNLVTSRKFDLAQPETVVLGGQTYTIELITITDNSATIDINGEIQNVSKNEVYYFGDLRVEVIDISAAGQSIFLKLGDEKVILDNRTVGSLNVGETTEIQFEFTPTESKWYDFGVGAYLEEDANQDNNEETFSIQAGLGEPDIHSSIYVPFPVLINQNSQIELVLWNDGFENAQNPVIDFYIIEPNDQNPILIESRNIGTITSTTQTELFDWTPTQEGWHQLIFNISYDYSQGSGSEEIWEWEEARIPGPDVESWMYTNNVELGQQATAEIYIDNEGTETAYNINYTFYDNNQIIEEGFFSSIDPQNSEYFTISWTPQGVGAHELNISVQADYDIDLENNDDSKTFYVYTMRDVTFNIFNATGDYISRYLGIAHDWNVPETIDLVTSPTLFTIPDLQTDFWIIQSENMLDPFSEYVVTRFVKSDLHSTMFVISEDYTNVRVEADKRLYRIYANEVFWNYDSSYIVFNYPDYTSLGIQDINNVTIYYCVNWDFDYETCISSWQEVPWIYKNIQGNSLYAASGYQNAEAFALGEPISGTFNDAEQRSEERIDFAGLSDTYKKSQRFRDYGFSEADQAYYYVTINGFLYNCDNPTATIEMQFNDEHVSNSMPYTCKTTLPDTQGGLYLAGNSYQGLKNITLNFPGADLVFYDSTQLIQVQKNLYLHFFGEEDSTGTHTVDVASFGATGTSNFNFANNGFTYFVVSINSLLTTDLYDFDVYLNGQLLGEIDVSNSNGKKGRGFAIPESLLGESNFNVEVVPRTTGELYLADVKMKTDFDPYYLTIAASYGAITSQDGSDYDEADFRVYGSLDDDEEGEFSVGRIMGITSSDFSSYLARILFFNKIERKQGGTIMMVGDHYDQRIPVQTCGTGFCECYFDFECDELAARYEPYFEPLETCNQDLINGEPQPYPSDCADETRLSKNIYQNSSFTAYADHGSPTGWPGLSWGMTSSNLQDLPPQIMYSFACVTCAYNSWDWDSADLFCTNTIRRGATGYIGGIENIYGHHFYDEFLDETLMNNKSIGYAFKIGKNKEARHDWLTPNIGSAVPYLGDIYGDQDILIGDPTFEGRIGVNA